MLRRLFLLLLPLAGLGGAWWWFVLRTPAPVDIGPGDGNGGAAVTAPSGAPAADPVPAPSAPNVPEQALVVDVAVTQLERYEPPPAPRVQAVSAVDGRPLPTLLLAGAGAGFDGAGATAGIALVRVDHGGMQALRQVAVSPGRVSEPAFASRLIQRGTVRGADEKPLAGVVVWFGEYTSDGREHVARTDAEGAYELDVLAGDGVPFVVRHPGMASQWRTVRVQAPLGPCDAVLRPGATVAVQLAGSAVAMTDARVYVLPTDSVTSELAMWPFFAQSLQDGFSLDDNGRASIEGLPRHGEVDLLVRHPRLPLARPTTVRLKGERALATIPVKFADRVLRGRIVDENGALLQGVSLWSLGAGQRFLAGSAQRLLPPHLDVFGAFATRSDDAGAFAIGVHAAADAVLRLRGHGFAGRDLPLAGLRDGVDLVLPAFVGGEPQFTLAPPVPGRPWFGRCDLAGGISAELPPDAPWRLSLPSFGRFQFAVRTRTGTQPPAEAPVREVAVTGPIELVAPTPQ